MPLNDTLTQRTCHQCGQPIQSQSAKKFCSRACYARYRSENLRGDKIYNWQGGPVERTCERCGASFVTPQVQVRNGHGRFCSIMCAKTKHDGKRSLGKNGYMRLRIGPRQWVLEHRWVMEQHLGRKLRTDEHVHHISGDRTDNRIENLQLMNRSEHMKLHRQAQLS